MATISIPGARAPAEQPCDGDVVVSRDPRTPGCFMIQQMPHAPQVSLPSRDKAVDVARRFARSQSVDLWVSDGHPAMRLQRHRPWG